TSEGTDNATYSQVTLGQPGPLAGSSATSALFTGSSLSVVQLPTKLVSGGSYQSVGMWIKTTTAGEGLLSSSADPIASAGTSNGYTPNLYLGSGGKLYGELWNGTASPIASSSPVTDGHWHFVVLTGAGNTQTLYVDGQPAGTRSGLINEAGMRNDYVGAGFLGGSWPDEPNIGSTSGFRFFYTGQISDVGVWARPLSGAEVAALYAAGTTAASPLTQVTRPSGKAYSQVSYSPVTGSVTGVTDDNGGTWQVAPLTVTGSSQVYVASVLGANPADYWRLADDSGPAAANVINGG